MSLRAVSTRLPLTRTTTTRTTTMGKCTIFDNIPVVKSEQGMTGLTARGMATKKQGGSTRNGRDSIGRRLGIKLYPGQHAKAGAIIVRQRGQKFRAGDNVGMGKDHTIFAKQAGTVRMTKLETNWKRNVVHIE